MMCRINFWRIVRLSFGVSAILLVAVVLPESNATVNVTVDTPGYVVFATESRAVNPADSTIITDSYEKLVQINDYSMIQVNGNMSFKGKSFKATIEEFCRQNNIGDSEKIDIDSLVTYFRTYISTQCTPKSLEELPAEFCIAALDKNGNPSSRIFYSKGDSVALIKDGQLFVNGQTRITWRLLYGIDPLLQAALLTFIKSDLGITDTLIKRISEFLESAQKEISLIRYKGPEHWPLNDAIDYASCIVHTTMVADKMSRVGIVNDSTEALGIPTTGGQILIMVLEGDGILWIQRPLYYYYMSLPRR